MCLLHRAFFSAYGGRIFLFNVFLGARMIQKMLFGNTIVPLAGKSLDAYAMRHKAIANNIANVEVEGYNRLEVKFEESLKAHLKPDSQALYRTHEDHLPEGQGLKTAPSLSVDSSNSKLNAINNVDIDLEMADLAKNQLNFNLLSTALRMEYNRIRMAIRGQ